MRNKILHSIATSRNVMRTLLIGVLILATASIALAQDLIPAIEIQPGTSVEVGEEVYLSATGTTYPDATILGKARYEWEFGDGYYHRFDPLVSTITRSGIAVTHYYMKPGTFTVTLKVTVWAEFDAAGTPVGSPLATKTTARIINIAGEAPMAGFEIQRAPFNNRLAQYLYVQIPTAYRGNSTQLKVSLVGAKGSSSVLLSKSSLASEERVFLDHKPLVQDDYVVIAELLNAGGTRISGGLWRDKFSKRYAGIPKVGIDENNAFRLDGALFFPIPSFMIDAPKIPNFVTQSSTNMLYTEGYYETHTPATWVSYLNEATKYNLAVIGPGRGNYKVDAYPNRWQFNHNPDRIADYVRTSKDSPAMFFWSWQDEPNMGGRAQKVYPPTLAAWVYIGHIMDAEHPSIAGGFYGSDWSKYYGAGLRDFDYLASASFFGGKKWINDVFLFDIYPIPGRLHPTLNFADMGTYAAYLDVLDRIHTNNKNLVPIIPAINPGNRNKNETVLIHSAEQVYFEAWISVIHGATGVSWFPYFDPENIRWAAMKKFADQMNVLAPVVLGPKPAISVTDNANTALNRVDTMIREKDGAVYVFAARVTEPDPIDGAKYTGVEPASITVSFKISGLTGSNSAEVVDEGRVRTVTDGKFTDTFAKNAVHIYKIAGVTTATLKAPAPRNLRAKKK